MSKTAFGMKLTNTSFKCVCIRKKYQEIRFRSRERGDEKKKVKCTAYIYQFTTRNVIIIYWKHTGKRIIIKANLPTSWKAVQIFLSAHTNIWHIYIYMRKHIHTHIWLTYMHTHGCLFTHMPVPRMCMCVCIHISEVQDWLKLNTGNSQKLSPPLDSGFGYFLHLIFFFCFLYFFKISNPCPSSSYLSTFLSPSPLSLCLSLWESPSSCSSLHHKRLRSSQYFSFFMFLQDFLLSTTWISLALLWKTAPILRLLFHFYIKYLIFLNLWKSCMLLLFLEGQHRKCRGKSLGLPHERFPPNNIL